MSSLSSSVLQDLPPLLLPLGIRERYISSDASDLKYHILEAGSQENPLILLVHGFPEIAYSWRKVMPGLARAGYYAVAVDQRGYGRTTGWDARSYHEVDLRTFSVTNLIRDLVVLVHALGYREVACIVGHDFGSVSASLCALARPDLFHKVILMSHPFKGSPVIPFDITNPEKRTPKTTSNASVHHALANLAQPRKHYKWYYATEAANSEMSRPEGLRDFLRGYFYLKSADWSGNKPYPLTAWTAEELAKMPLYYIMPRDAGMRDVVVQEVDDEVEKSLVWLPEADLDVYEREYSRTGFQGGLNWYRTQTDPSNLKDFDMFAGKVIEVPSLFISGKKDWGTYQEPGVIENMANVCSDFKGVRLLEGAGHWVQQEQPVMVVNEILAFVKQSQ
ncbi:hypothetical protein MMC19_004007 [Ptychographa xylographoides]|nr:hypothetical protein [Ptychographa xylographoides]